MIGKVTRNASFNRIAQYITGKPGAEILLENVPEGNTVAQKAAAMQFVAARNHRVKRPAYHLSLSPAESDNLSRRDWMLFCNQVLDELGFKDNQVLVGLHHDVKYPNSEKTRTHAHLLINLVNDAGKCSSTSWDYYKIPQVLRHLERCYGLQAVNDVGEVGKHLDSAGQYQLQRRSEGEGEAAPIHRSVRCKLQDMIDEILKRCGSFEELAIALQSQGVEVNLTSTGWWVQYEGFPFAGHQLGRAYTKPSVLKRLEAEVVDEGRREDPTSTLCQESSKIKSLSNSVDDNAQPSAELVASSIESNAQSAAEVVASSIESNAQSAAEVVTESVDENAQPAVKLMSEPEESAEDIQPLASMKEAFIEANTLFPSSEQSFGEVCGEHIPIPLVVEDSEPTPDPATPNPESQTGQQLESGESSTSPAWLSQLKRKAHELEQTELIDGKFYTGLAMDVVAHSAELVREIRGNDHEDVPQPESSLSSNPEFSESSPEAVAESLSQFVQARAEVHGLNPDEPIATNLGTLHLDSSSDDKTLTITRNITVAQWDEKSTEWQIDSDLAEKHQFSVSQLLNNQVVDTEGYRLVGDEEERVVTFEEVRFQAIEISGEWQVTENHLTEDEQNRILKLPQSSQDYNRTKDGKDLVNYFQRHAPEQFDSDIGVINWTAENGEFDRRFEVSVQPDKSVLIEGFDLKQKDEFGNSRQIFKAEIGIDSAISCSQCDIDSRDIDQLLQQESSSRQKQQPERSRTQYSR
ncbi:MAG: relaxase/mobilization nuclease domain-containing protein [Microcoleaceae cyanobacterium]